MDLFSPLGLGAMSLVLFIGGAVGPQGPGREDRVDIDYIQENAKKAKESDERSVRDLVDVLFDRSILRNVPENVRERIVRADLAFRRKQQRGIREQDLVSAANYFAGRFGGPDYTRTTIGQVRGHREITRLMAPHLASENGIPRGIDDEMSPVEAVYIASSLGRQKLWNPDYQVPPEEWERGYQAKKARAKQGLPPQVEDRRAERAKVASREVTDLLWALDHDLHDPSTPVAIGLDMFLDRIGIHR